MTSARSIAGSNADVPVAAARVSAPGRRCRRSGFSLANLSYAVMAAAILATVPASSAEDWNFRSAASYSRKTGGRLLLIWQDGRPATVDAARGFTPESPVNVFSITKSVAALGVLAAPGFAPAKSFPQPPGTSGRRGAEIGRLLSQTSGISTGYERIYGRRVKDVRATAASLPAVHPPGAVFEYGPSHYELLGLCFGHSAGGSDPARTVLEKKILAPLGIRPRGWRFDGSRKIYLSAGAVLSGNDLLKLGQLVLDKGCAGRSRRIIPEKHLRLALTGSPANPAYGFGFWLNGNASGPAARERDVESAIGSRLSTLEWKRMCLSRCAPADMVAMVGSGGQRVYVIPSRRMVIVRLGRPGGFQDPAFFRALTGRRLP